MIFAEMNQKYVTQFSDSACFDGFKSDYLFLVYLISINFQFTLRFGDCGIFWFMIYDIYKININKNFRDQHGEIVQPHRIQK